MGPAPNTVSRETADELHARIIPPGAVIYAKIGAALFLNRRRVTSTACCIDNNMTAYLPNPASLTPDWAWYWTSILDFGEYGNPGAVPSLSEGYQSTLPLVRPPTDEQRVLTAYLDRLTIELDELAAKTATAIERL